MITNLLTERRAAARTRKLIKNLRRAIEQLDGDAGVWAAWVGMDKPLCKQLEFVALMMRWQLDWLEQELDEIAPPPRRRKA